MSNLTQKINRLRNVHEAAQYLAISIDKEPEFRDWLVKFVGDYPEDWQFQRDPYYPPQIPRLIHMTTGMGIRNCLREVGFTDEVMGTNLDDVYVEITNLAVDILKGLHEY